MSLNKHEARVLDAMTKDPAREWTVEQLARFWFGRAKRPETWRNGINARMRRLCAKTRSGPARIERASGRGRGAVARYVLKCASRRQKNAGGKAARVAA